MLIPSACYEVSIHEIFGFCNAIFPFEHLRSSCKYYFRHNLSIYLLNHPLGCLLFPLQKCKNSGNGYEVERPFPTCRASNQPRFGKFRKNSLRSEEHTSELQSRQYLVCRLLLEKKK